jgi:gamma-glutamylcyclotransferase (GGCT)/AIG2-like uncharacterized protein YtfP
LSADHLFVYGTLRRGSNNQFVRLLSERGTFVTDARVPGRLYDFGAYPGAVPSDQLGHWVHGEIHRLEDPSLLASLDEYEGLEYARAMVSATLDDGQIIDCWIYWYVGDSKDSLIESGDWLQR